MKKIIFFDLDNTIHSTKKKEVPSQTIQLLKELSKMSNVELGLATGRGPSKVHLLDDLLSLFKYKIYFNGALAYKDDTLFFEKPISLDKIKEVVNLASRQEISVGFVAKEGEYINKRTIDVDFGINEFQDNYPLINKEPYLSTNIYQLWLFSKDQPKLEDIAKRVRLNYYPWHTGGADLVETSINKAEAIKMLLKSCSNYQLIAVGDGKNDLAMIKMADIGIVMGNSGFSEVRKKADYIAPHIDDNQLYEFFKNIKIIS